MRVLGIEVGDPFRVLGRCIRVRNAIGIRGSVHGIEDSETLSADELPRGITWVTRPASFPLILVFVRHALVPAGH